MKSYDSPNEWIPVELEKLRQKGLKRSLVTCAQACGAFESEGKRRLNFASNNYLDLAEHPDVLAASESALRQFGCSAASSRLLAGTLPCHDALEQRLANLKGYPRALVLGSGFLANLAAVTALAGRGDHVFLDKLCHASLVDAAILSRAALYRFRHNDPEHLKSLLATAGKGRRLVLTESVFSMDGDIAPLRQIAEITEKAGAMLLVDEAHATGVLGPNGAGLVRELGLTQAVTVSMGTFSKALGSYGGFLACSTSVCDWLINRGRAFIYSTALPPAACGAALGALDVLERTPDMGKRLLANAQGFCARLHAAGFQTGGSRTQIVPVLLGSNERALSIAGALREHAIIAPAIRPPTVPTGTARLRLSVTLAHTRADLDAVASLLAGFGEKF